MVIRLLIICDVAGRAMRIVIALSMFCVLTTTTESRRLVAQTATGPAHASFRIAPPGASSTSVAIAYISTVPGPGLQPSCSRRVPVTIQ